MIDHNLLFPAFDEKLGVLLEKLQAAGLAMHGIQGFRTHEQQHELYEQGRTKPGPIVTAADSGHSPHEYGCAADMAFGGAQPFVGDWQAYGRCVNEVPGLTWGGSWGDKDHVEYTAWRTVRAQGWKPGEAT